MRLIDPNASTRLQTVADGTRLLHTFSFALAFTQCDSSCRIFSWAVPDV